jgi:acyl carrier protein
MGLDSVELLVAFENYFGIEITNAEAEKIYTAQSMVEVVAKHLAITDNNGAFEMQIFRRIVDSLHKISPQAAEITPTDLISSYMSPDDQNWAAFKHHLGLEIPVPHTNSWFSNTLKKVFNQSPGYDWHTITIQQFASVLAAANFDTLIDKNNIHSKYEIYIAIMGITVNRSGIDSYAITPDKSFTNDLGID